MYTTSLMFTFRRLSATTDGIHPLVYDLFSTNYANRSNHTPVIFWNVELSAEDLLLPNLDTSRRPRHHRYRNFTRLQRANQKSLDWLNTSEHAPTQMRSTPTHSFASSHMSSSLCHLVVLLAEIDIKLKISDIHDYILTLSQHILKV